MKLIAVLDEEDVKDAEMKALFRRLHALYVDTISNPFHDPDTELYSCASFGRQVERIVEVRVRVLAARSSSSGSLSCPSFPPCPESRLDSPHHCLPLHRAQAGLY